MTTYLNESRSARGHWFSARRTRLSLLMVALLLVLSLAMPVSAYATGADGASEEAVYVFDQSGLFTGEQLANLQQQAFNTSEYYQCGVYFVAVDDYNDYSSSGDVLTAAEDIYIANGFGRGDDQSGVMLLLSMNERDYALIAYGDLGNMAFTDYGKYLLEDCFLDDFRDGHWYSGALDYILECDSYLAQAVVGTPVDVPADNEDIYYDPTNDDYYYYEEEISFAGLLLVTVIPAAVVSGVVCFFLYRSMKTARRQTVAFEYIVDGKINFRKRTDRFTHATQSRRRIKTNNNSGGKSGGVKARGGTRVNSRGFSGRKGKF